MNRLLHITPNKYPKLDVNHSTKRIWYELSKEFDEYHIIGRSLDNGFHYYVEGKFHLHLVPKITNKNWSFGISSLYLFRLVKKIDFNLIISQCPILGGPIAASISKKRNIPLLQEIHEVFYFEYFNKSSFKNQILKNITRFTLNRATKIRALNNEMKKMLLDINISDNKIEIIENRVDLTIFSETKNNYQLHNPIKLVCIGNFIPSKNHTMLFNVMEKLKFKYSIKLLLIGGGRLRGEYEKIIEKLGIDVTLYDRVTQNELELIMKDSDIYVHSSITEGMPRVILEAMAMGMPILTTDAGTIKGTVIEGVNGLIVNVKDFDLYIKKLTEFIEDEYLRSKCGKQAYIDACNLYEWKISFEKYRAVLKEMRK